METGTLRMQFRSDPSEGEREERKVGQEDSQTIAKV